MTMFARVTLAGIVLADAPEAQACLVGTWVVRCPDGHDNTVNDITCQHECETTLPSGQKCGKQVFDGSWVTVVCPDQGAHPNRVNAGEGRDGNRDTWLKSKKCDTCGKECNRSTTAATPAPRRDPCPRCL